MATQTTDRRINLYINGKEVRNNIKSIAAEYKKSKNQLAKLTRGTDEYNRKAAEVRKYKSILDEHNNQLRQTQSRWQKLIGQAKNYLPVLGVGTAVLGAKRLAHFIDRLEKMRYQVKQLTGVGEKEGLNGLTASIKAVSETFEEDFNEVLTANNALAEGMQISHQEAIEIIKEGYLAGANASGEFLAMLKEYPALLREIGLNADQAVGFMTQQVKRGIFTDKGVDAIKEANIRIREMTKATQEAIDNIGLSSEEIQEQLVSGDKSMFEIIQMISNRLDEFPATSKKVGTAIADIFGGPGEDAGVKFLTTIGDINTELEGMVDNTDDLAVSQRIQLQATEELNSAYLKLLGKQSALNKLWQNTKLVLGKTLNDIASILTSDKLSLGQKLAGIINPVQRELLAVIARGNEVIDQHNAQQEKLRKTLIQQAESYGISAEALKNLTNDEIKNLIEQRKAEIRANREAAESAEGTSQRQKEAIEKLVPFIKGVKQETDKATDSFIDLDMNGIQRVINATNELEKAFLLTLPEKDIFGMTQEDWDNVVENFQKVQAGAWEIGMTLSNVAQIQKNQNEKELRKYREVQEQKKQSLERRLDAGIISEKEYNQRVEKMEEELSEKQSQLAREEARRQKQINTFQAIIDTAAAIIGYLARPGGIPGLVLSGMAAVTGATQIAAIQSQPVPQFAEGGRVKKNQVIEVAEGDKEEGILSNRTLTDSETGPLANYLLDKQAGITPAVPDAGAIAQAMDYNNYKRAGGGYSQSTSNVTNNYTTYQTSDEKLTDILDKLNGKIENIHAVISNDMIKENEEEQQLLDSLNKM